MDKRDMSLTERPKWCTDELYELLKDRAAKDFIANTEDDLTAFLEEIAYRGLERPGVNDMSVDDLVNEVGISTYADGPAWDDVGIATDGAGDPHEDQLKAFLKYGDAALCPRCGLGPCHSGPC